MQNTDIRSVLDRVMQGQGHADDTAVLRDSLHRLDPKSPEYQQIISVLGIHPSSLPAAGPAASFRDIGPLTRPSAAVLQNYGRPEPTPGITSGLPSTDPNLEAMLHQPGTSYEAGADPEIGGLSIPKSQAQKEMLAQMMANVPQGPGGAALTANPGLDWQNQYQSNEVDPLDAFFYEVANTPFANASPEMIDTLVRNPVVLTHLLAQQQGGGANSEAFLGPRVEAALALAGTGMLGRGTRGRGPLPGLDEAPADDLQKLLAAQEFMDQFNAPGTQFVDTNALYQDAFNRATNTDLRSQTDQQGRAIGIEGEIELTNKALLAAAPFMSQEEQAWVSSALQSAAVEYMTKVTMGEISMSYPNYLRSIGIDQMLAGS